MKVMLNPDIEFRNEVIKALKENDNYCPCKIIKNDDTKCMCKEFKEQIKVGLTGPCHCGLYIITEETV